MKTFSILGCGYLGLSLVEKLKSSYKIKIATRSKIKEKEFERLGFTSYVLACENKTNLKKFLKCDILFISLPPKDENYLKFLKVICKNAKTSTKIIFISSTSIYPNIDFIFNENFVIKNNEKSLVNKAEKIMKKRADIIYRCAGLMGGSRVAGKYFSNKEVKNSHNKVNYVHKNDVIRATKFALQKKLVGIYNLCSPSHPSKKEVYLNNANKHNFLSPIFLKDEEKDMNRLISTSKILKKGFKYKYKNPLDFD